MYGHRPPNAAQLDKQIRQTGLTTAIKAYEEDPDLSVLLDPTAWVNLGESPPTLKAFKDGETYTLSTGYGVTREFAA